MTQIKKVKTSEGVQFYPQTHTKAVIDDNGYTAESRLGAMQDEINQAQLEVGAVPSDIAPTEGSTNWVTSGGVYNSIQRIIAGSELDETTIDAEMTSGTRIYTDQGVGNECPLTTTSFSAFDCAIINLKHNQVVNISGVGGNKPRLWAILDNSTNEILSVAYANTATPNSPYTESIVASQDCKVVVNVYNNKANPPYGNTSSTPYSITVTSKGEGEGALAKIQKDINSINKKIEGISLMHTVDSGLYFVDSSFNIGAYFDNDGFHAINMLEYEKI